MPISESHFTGRHYLHFPKYKIDHIKPPDDKDYGGTAIIIQDSIKHYKWEFAQKYLKASIMDIEDTYGPVTSSTIYCHPKHKKQEAVLLKFP